MTASNIAHAAADAAHAAVMAEHKETATECACGVEYADDMRRDLHFRSVVKRADRAWDAAYNDVYARETGIRL